MELPCCQVPNILEGRITNLCPECGERFAYFAHVCQPCDVTICHPCYEAHKMREA